MRRWPWPSWRNSSRSVREPCPDVVGTIGMLNVPNGSINVVRRCLFSLDLRATTNAARDALAATCSRN